MTKTVEVRSAVNDNVVISFEHAESESVNIVTAGFNKICSAFGISRLQAENQYYVTKG